MEPFVLPFGFSFADLYKTSALESLDKVFLSFLEESSPDLTNRLRHAREFTLPTTEESALLLDIAPYIEDFIGSFFSIEEEIQSLQNQTFHLAPLYRCKRLFVQRQAAKTFSKEEALAFNGSHLQEKITTFLGKPYSDLAFANFVLKALDDNSTYPEFLNLAVRYAAWALYQERTSLLFRLPKKVNFDVLFPLNREGNVLTSPSQIKRKELACTNSSIGHKDALDQAHYCILCHKQGKDSCSKGYSDNVKGCPLNQKISEMNTLRTQGYVVGALAMIMVDNPMLAATGHSICNDCEKACIFQKQEAVDIPSVETETLESVLNLPWGVEIYSLLSRWNPLNLTCPFPKRTSGYAVLVAGMGPAGFTLSHYLLNEGHRVVGVDGLKIEPLEKSLLTQPIHNWSTLNIPLHKRTIEGFGGVMEYGITARWNKNYLKLIRLLLERRSHFALYDSIRLGGTIFISQAFELGFDHVALCLGAGGPNTLSIPQGLARGMRLASDFLMALQLTGAAQEKSLANLQIRLPILVIGGGLTAVDTATEALAYYAIQVKNFLKHTDELGGLPSSLSEEEVEIAQEFLTHARALQRGDYSFLNKAVSIVYRKTLKDSPSYRLNPKELQHALAKGITFFENATPLELQVDDYGHVKSLTIQTPTGIESLPCRALLVATGTHPNKILEQEDPDLKIEGKGPLLSYKGRNTVSFFGDLDPSYEGNVVKAMASAKNGYKSICNSLSLHPPSASSDLFRKLNDLLCPRIEKIHRLTPTTLEIVIKAPQVVSNFKPGQFFRFQNYGPQAMEGLALTGTMVDHNKGLLSLIVLETGGSSLQCQYLKEGERVALMGPTGTPTEIPNNQTVLLIGGGLGNAVLFSIGRALKQKGNRVLYIAGYKKPEDCFKAEEIQSIAEQVIWCFESLSAVSSPQSNAIQGLKPLNLQKREKSKNDSKSLGGSAAKFLKTKKRENIETYSEQSYLPYRPQDFLYEGNVIEGLLNYAESSPLFPLNQVDHIIAIGSDTMMAAVNCARKTILKPYLNSTHTAIGSINAPMQCMMKEICGQCIQLNRDRFTGKARVVFSCAAQDQNLDEVDFDILHNRLQQNSLLEKQKKIWIEKLGLA